MTPENRALGERVAAWHEYRLREGMLLEVNGTECRVARIDEQQAVARLLEMSGTTLGHVSLTGCSWKMIPDLGDPATLGCVLDELRGVMRDEGVSTIYVDGGWTVGRFEGGAFEVLLDAPQPTEREALVAALETL